LFHFTNGNAAFLSDSSALKIPGGYGFPLFFMISGFVIPLVMDKQRYQFPRDTADFATRRLIRLEPTYLCSIAITLALTVLSAALPFTNATLPSISISDVALHLGYLAPWFDVPWIVPIYWALAIEFQFYFLMLLAAPALLSLDARILWAFIAAVAAASFLSADSRLIFPCLPLFGMGFALFLLRSGRFGRLSFLVSVTTFAAIAILIQGLPVVGALMGCLFLALVRIRSLPPTLTLLSTIAFSFILLHIPIGGRIINLAARLPSHPVIQIAAIVLAFAVSIAAAYLLWRFVERPTMLLLSARFRRKRKDVAVRKYA
jgi:peptidoglycan/LPS O-acetylase OafA/YrhL